MPKKEIYFEASYDPNKKIINIDGDGAATITFTTDATQLASVLLSLAKLKGCRIGITLKKVYEKPIEKTGAASQIFR